MAHHNFTKEQRSFLTNYERATSAGISQQAAKDVYYAILAGLNTCKFPNGSMASTADEKYLSYLEDMLFDKAVEEGKQNEIKWVGIES